VDRCDALIALWDGKKSRGRGGTAEIVGYAQEHGVPIAWVHTEGELVVDYALENSRVGIVKAAASKLCEYNARMIEPARPARLCTASGPSGSSAATPSATGEWQACWRRYSAKWPRPKAAMIFCRCLRQKRVAMIPEFSYGKRLKAFA
jgi:hypothetical protein